LSSGWSGSINVLNVLMPAAFGGSKVFAMNLGNTFFGLGAFLTPLAVVFLLRRVGFTPALLILACFALVSGVLAVGVDFATLATGEDSAASADVAPAGMAALVQNPIMWLCAVALFFYLPLEATMAAWFTTYLGERGVSEGVASGLLSCFWLAFMASRLTVAFGLPAGLEQPLLVGMAVAGTAVLAGVVWSRRRGTAMALVIAAGLVFGPMFPTLIGVLLGHTDPALHGRAVGIFFALGGVGWMTIPMLIGTYARRTSVQRGFLIAVAAAIGLCIMTVSLLCLG
jgi:fucose permease